MGQSKNRKSAGHTAFMAGRLIQVIPDSFSKETEGSDKAFPQHGSARIGAWPHRLLFQRLRDPRRVQLLRQRIVEHRRNVVPFTISLVLSLRFAYISVCESLESASGKP